MLFNIFFFLFSCLRRLGLRITPSPLSPSSLRCHLRSTGSPARLSPLWWSCNALALARSSSAGAKRAHVALPVTPDWQGSSGHRRPHHHAQRKKARVHEEPVPSPPRHRDDDDYSPSDVDDESTSGTKSDRLNPVLSLACFVWLFLVARWALGPGPLGSGPRATGRFPFRGPCLNLRFFASSDDFGRGDGRSSGLRWAASAFMRKQWATMRYVDKMP